MKLKNPEHTFWLFRVSLDEDSGLPGEQRPPPSLHTPFCIAPSPSLCPRDPLQATLSPQCDAELPERWYFGRQVAVCDRTFLSR